MVDFLDTFLGEEEVTGIPVGGGFQPSGMIGQWIAGVAFRVGWTDVDLVGNDEVKFDSRAESQSGKYRYYFRSQETARKAAEAIGSSYPPEAVWQLSTQKVSILNFFNDDVKAAFGDVISYDIPIKTPASKKYRHEFHLIALPYAVQATALMLGTLKEPLFNANEILRSPDDQDYNDAFQRELTGDPDGQGVESMLDSVLGRRRSELWKALGEENGLAYLPEGHDGTAKYVSNSAVLSNLLTIYTKVWKSPVYAEVVTFYDPRVDAGYTNRDGNPTRPRVPAITRFFLKEEDAKAVAEEQMQARDGTGEAAVSATTAEPAVATANGAAPGVPEAWADIADDWESELRGSVERNTSNDSAIANELGATIPQVKAWRKHLGI